MMTRGLVTPEDENCPCFHGKILTHFTKADTQTVLTPERHNAISHLVFLLVPIVGAFFIYVANALAINLFMSLPIYCGSEADKKERWDPRG